MKQWVGNGAGLTCVRLHLHRGVHVCMCVCMCCCFWWWQDGLKVGVSSAIQLHPGAKWMLTKRPVFPQTLKWSVAHRQAPQTAAQLSVLKTAVSFVSFSKCVNSAVCPVYLSIYRSVCLSVTVLQFCRHSVILLWTNRRTTSATSGTWWGKSVHWPRHDRTSPNLV